MRDYQRGKVYDWQDKYIRRNYGSAWESIYDMQKLAAYIVKKFKLSSVIVKVEKRLRFNAGQYDIITKNIDFHPYWIRKWVLLHELAHHMTPNNHEHSPLFMQNFCILLHRYMKVPKRILRSSLQLYKIDYKEF